MTATDKASSGVAFMPAAKPQLSVIIPTYNRASALARTLDAFLVQTCPADQFELIICDDGSTDHTKELAGTYAEQYPQQIHYLHQANTGANAARNYAIAHSQAPLLLLINDDIVPHQEMVAEHLAGHENHPADNQAILGKVTILPELAQGKLAPLHLDRAFVSLEAGKHYDWRKFFTCNVSFKRSLFDQTHGFETSIRYHEDLEFSQRLIRFGLEVIYHPQALGYHNHDLTDRELFAVAKREAEALVRWGKLRPNCLPELAQFGYQAAPSYSTRIKYLIAYAIINPVTQPLWLTLARTCPGRIARPIYDRLYRYELRQALKDWQRQLNEGHASSG